MSKITQLTGPFAAHELVPVIGSHEPTNTDAMDKEIEVARATYKAIHVNTARHEAVNMHYKRVMAQRVAPGRPVLGGRVLGPSGSGKSTSAEHFQTMIEAQNLHAEGEAPVVITSLESSSTSRRLFVSTLHSLKDGFSTKGTEEVLKERVYMALRRKKTRLLIVDEVQHLAARSNNAHSTTDTLKRLLDDGVCPIVFIGTDEAKGFLNSNIQLANRLMPPADMKPLSDDDADDRKLFATYVNMLDRELVKSRLTARPSGLAEMRVLRCLYTISSGVLGRVSNLVRVALENALRRGANVIEIHDLSAATTEWAIATGVLDYNPFLVAGPQKRGGRA